MDYSSLSTYVHLLNLTLLNDLESYDEASDILLVENASTTVGTVAPKSGGGDSNDIWEAGKVRIPLYSVIFLLGITGNVLVIVTLVQNSRMRTVTNMFLLNLAVSDLLLGVFCMPFTLVGTLLRDFIFGETFCKLLPFLQAVSVSVSGWTLVAISVERFYAICHPLTSRRWQTVRHSRLIILLVWIVSLGAMSPVAILTKLQPIRETGRHKCREVWPDATSEQIFTLYLDVLLLVLPLVIMAAMYALIVRHLWGIDQAGEDGSSSIMADSKGQEEGERHYSVTSSRSLGRGAESSSSKNSRHAATRASAGPSLRRCNAEQCLKTKRRVLKMLFVVVLEFFVCWTPLYVVNTVSLFAPRALYEGLGYIGISLVQLLAHASCCCNPITYCFMSSSFRRAFLAAFGCNKTPHGEMRTPRTVV